MCIKRNIPIWIFIYTLSFHLTILDYFIFSTFLHTHTHTHTHTHKSTHTHKHTHIHTHTHIYLIEHDRHFLSTCVFVNPFELPYRSYDIRRELIDKPSIISYFPSTFCPTLGHHQGRMYYKSDITFVCTLLLCKTERLYCCIMYRLLFEFVSINSVNSWRHLSTLALVSKIILLIFGFYVPNMLCLENLLFLLVILMF